MKKAIFVANTDTFHKNFHIPYIDKLKKAGYEVELVSSGDVNFDGIAKRRKVVFGRTPANKQNVKAFFDMRKIFSEYYDLIYFSTPVVGAIGRMALLGKKHGRVIYSAHGYTFYKGNNPRNNVKYLFIEKQLSRITDCIFTMNEEDYQASLTNGFYCKEIYNVNGMGVDISKFQAPSQKEKLLLRREYGYSQGSYILVYPAELTKRKNQILLFQIVEKLVSDCPNVKLLILGEGIKKAEYIHVVEQMNISKHVDFLGYREDVQKFLRLSDVLVASSLNEGLPINIIEGLATGLPVIATAVRGHVDLIEEAENGFLFEPKDMEKAVTVLHTLMNNRILYRNLSAKARISSKKYDIYRVSQEYDKIFFGEMSSQEAT